MGESVPTRYKRAQVAASDGRGGGPLWIVYKDSVYDVTKYIHEHPGGVDPLTEEAGRDCTKAFEEVGHSADARSILNKFKIGEIVEEEKIYDENGKKIKRKVLATGDEEPAGRSCLSVCTCGLL